MFSGLRSLQSRPGREGEHEDEGKRGRWPTAGLGMRPLCKREPTRMHGAPVHNVERLKVLQRKDYLCAVELCLRFRVAASSPQVAKELAAADVLRAEGKERKEGEKVRKQEGERQRLRDL